MTPGPMDFRRPMGLKRLMGVPIKMEHRRLFFWRSPDFEQKNRFYFAEAPPPIFFWRSPDFGQNNRFNFGEGQKNRFNFGEDLFFSGDHLNLVRKTVSILVKTFFLEIT